MNKQVNIMISISTCILIFFNIRHLFLTLYLLQGNYDIPYTTIEECKFGFSISKYTSLEQIIHYLIHNILTKALVHNYVKYLDDFFIVHNHSSNLNNFNFYQR